MRLVVVLCLLDLAMTAVGSTLHLVCYHVTKRNTLISTKQVFEHFSFSNVDL